MSHGLQEDVAHGLLHVLQLVGSVVPEQGMGWNILQRAAQRTGYTAARWIEKKLCLRSERVQEARGHPIGYGTEGLDDHISPIA